MATWVRAGTGTAPSATNNDLTGTVSLDSGTAPADFDPDAVSSVRFQWRLSITGLSDDTWVDQESAALTDGTNTPASVDAGNNNRTASGDYDKDTTDSTVSTGLSTATWEGLNLRSTTAGGAWATFSANKKADGSTASIPVANVTVTITYTPSAGTVTGSAAITETGDTASASGAVLVDGSAAITEANDTASASGAVLVDGSAAITEANDTASASGGVLVGGAAALTDAGDTVSASGTVSDAPITGSAAITEANDTASASGGVLVGGAAALTDAGDTATATGAVLVDGSASVAEANDSASASGSVTGGAVTGTASIIESADSAVATGSLLVAGSATVTESSDVASVMGGVVVSGSGAGTEQDDTATATGAVAGEIVGVGGLIDLTDIVEAFGQILIDHQYAGSIQLANASDGSDSVSPESGSKLSSIGQSSRTIVTGLQE